MAPDLIGPKSLRLQRTLAAKGLSRSDEHADAVVAVLLQEAEDFDLLLIHRAERSGDPWSGQIGLPGGRVEPTDSSNRSALEREVKEEIGVDLNQHGKELGTLSLGAPMKNLETKVQPWVYGLHGRPKPTIGPEVQEIFWVKVSKLQSLRTTSEIELRGVKRDVDAFLVEGHVVWGYTHRVLNELLSVLSQQ